MGTGEYRIGAWHVVPWLRARQPFGRIAIANSDAANNAMAKASFSEAHRAIREVLGG